MTKKERKIHNQNKAPNRGKIYYRYSPYTYNSITMTVGDEFEVHKSYNGSPRGSVHCKLIKVTRKGFNFLDMERSVCILRSHMYGVDMAGKEYPKNKPITHRFRVPDWISLTRIEPEEKEKKNGKEQ